MGELQSPMNYREFMGRVLTNKIKMCKTKLITTYLFEDLYFMGSVLLLSV